ncbi:hypothetical protein C8J47_3753 [Sphingomonas sp. PP-F2F-G114-C0414]|uniref:hypothetical protein n=1 Tax=Sphingomonas sp. PP-F2F-G114-C0414 TaxID=2135662 RepID=UPI000EF8FBC9|nr:hypothetical protein [Sphingomonas sp. PP-F2F-G114-C0414]RMB24852.1 hypothetical protein C8J47_3753 [Sphingomonas sp. PP-F2F-G114-C0414]
MSSEPISEPDPTGLVIFVGQDRAGHWLVQDSRRTLEGRFISYAAAMHYAQAERDIYHASVEVAAMPLTPLVSFAPVGCDERALPRAA